VPRPHRRTDRHAAYLQEGGDEERLEPEGILSTLLLHEEIASADPRQRHAKKRNLVKRLGALLGRGF